MPGRSLSLAEADHWVTFVKYFLTRYRSSYSALLSDCKLRTKISGDLLCLGYTLAISLYWVKQLQHDLSAILFKSLQAILWCLPREIVLFAEVLSSSQARVQASREDLLSPPFWWCGMEGWNWRMSWTRMIGQMQNLLRHIILVPWPGSETEEVSLWLFSKRNWLETMGSRNTEIQFSKISTHGKIISTSSTVVSFIEQQEKNTVHE